MPGSSVWLIPPADCPIYHVLEEAIGRIVPAQFPNLTSPPQFLPHLTLTSDVPKEVTNDASQAQRWLDAQDFSSCKECHVRFVNLDVGEIFVKKLTLSTEKAPLLDLSIKVRAASVENGDVAKATVWATEEWKPHVSLLYASVEVTEEERRKVLRAIQSLGIEAAGEPDLSGYEGNKQCGWTGGRVVLVPTWKKIPEWHVVAERAI